MMSVLIPICQLRISGFTMQFRLASTITNSYNVNTYWRMCGLALNYLKYPVCSLAPCLLHRNKWNMSVACNWKDDAMDSTEQGKYKRNRTETRACASKKKPYSDPLLKLTGNVESPEGGVGSGPAIFPASIISSHACIIFLSEASSLSHLY